MWMCVKNMFSIYISFYMYCFNPYVSRFDKTGNPAVPNIRIRNRQFSAGPPVPSVCGRFHGGGGRRLVQSDHILPGFQWWRGGVSWWYLRTYCLGSPGTARLWCWLISHSSLKVWVKFINIYIIYNTFWYSQQNGGGGGGGVSFWSLFDIIQNYTNIHALSVFEPWLE